MINLSNWLLVLIEACTFYGGGNKSGGGGGNTTTIQKADPWSGVQPYITDYLKLGQNTTRNPYQFYNGDTVAGFSPEQEAGFNLGTQRALAGSPTLNAANQSITNTLNGDYLSPDSNPYLRANVDRALGDVQTRVNSQFNNPNFGGTAHQELLTRNLGETASQLYGQNYSQERQNQMSAANQAIPLAGADYLDSQMLQGIGAQRQGLANQYLGNASTQFNNAAQFPYDQLNRYSDVIRAGQGAGGTTTSSSNGGGGGSTLGDIAGLGLAGAGLYSSGALGALGGALGFSSAGALSSVVGAGGFGSLLSDERLKTDIKKVGELPSGLGVYDYKKFGQQERGVLAQEVEQVMPEAVSTHPSGYKMVKYGLLN